MEIRIISTTGDQRLEISLAEIGGKAKRRSRRASRAAEIARAATREISAVREVRVFFSKLDTRFEWSCLVDFSEGVSELPP